MFSTEHWLCSSSQRCIHLKLLPCPRCTMAVQRCNQYRMQQSVGSRELQHGSCWLRSVADILALTEFMDVTLSLKLVAAP